MKQRLGVIVGILAAFLVGSFAIAGPASAEDPGTVKPAEAGEQGRQEGQGDLQEG